MPRRTSRNTARRGTRIPIAVSGCAGRMGSRIVQLASEEVGVRVVGALEWSGSPNLGQAVPGAPWVTITDDVPVALRGAKVLIEFTEPKATVEHVKAAQRAGVGMVIGTTGLTAVQERTIRRASQRIPVLLSPNMSLGVNLLFDIVEQVAGRLSSFDAEIVEAHHRMKKDAPSGTARRLAELVADAREQSLQRVGVYGRQGITGARPNGQIAVHAVRAGDIVGDHTVTFAGPFERVELTHRAHSRDVFAIGAIRAAVFLAPKRSGWYTMRDVLQSFVKRKA